MRIGIFGGMFNPPHIAHLIAGERAAEEFELDRLLFIVGNQPPLKPVADLASGTHRLAMTTLATEGNPVFEASGIELERDGKSYTVDTLRELKRDFPDAELYLFIGMDNLASFKSWHDYEEIFKLTKVVAMSRPTHEVGAVDPYILKQVQVMPIPLLEISSTEVRERVRNGMTIQYLVPEAVRRYINESGLYR